VSAAVRVMSWGMPLLYVGPSFKLPVHRKGVGFLCLCLDGSMEIETPGQHVTCRSAYLDPGVPHQVDFEGRTIACLYVDQDSALPEAILAEMKPAEGGLYTQHRRQSAIVDLLSEESPLLERHRSRIADVLGISPWTIDRAERRVRAVLNAILAEPAGRHSVMVNAERVRLSESRLRHAFRDATGVPLRRFRLWARMGLSLHLVGGGASLTRAAHEAGFSSSAHFSSAYRAMFGLKPSLVVRANPALVNFRGDSTAPRTGSPAQPSVNASPSSSLAGPPLGGAFASRPR
jgi:AraC-like DNA-binding protein